jgi:hypothetical protein
MDPVRQQRILEALRTLARPGLAQDALLECVRQLDAEVASPSSGLPGDLDHYLRRRSYEKALLFLEGGKPSAGSCGRGA